MQPDFQPFGQQPQQPAPAPQPAPQPVAPAPQPAPAPFPAPAPAPAEPVPPLATVPVAPSGPASGHGGVHPHSKWFFIGLAAIVLAVIGFGLAGWALFNYINEKNTVDTQVESAVATAKKEQADADAANFAEKEKEPNREFAGPDDYGRLAFKYPKTWSSYVETEGNSRGTAYKAFLHPISVPPVSDQQQFALRVTIEQVDYDKEIARYSSAVEKGDLKSSAVTVGGTQGTRLDGTFSKDIRGSAVIFKIRDKVVTLRSDADTFKGDFDTLIATITFNA